MSDDQKWYIVNVQTSCEAIAKASIEDNAVRNGVEDKIGEVLIPSESVVEMVKGQKKTRSRKFFPGYVFVKMEMSDETWHSVRKSNKVTGFVGSTMPPASVPEEEVMRVTKQMEEGAEKPRPRINFDVGEEVTVIDGPFSNFSGSVEEINEEKAKVKVLVSIFGRPTPVELDFVQVRKD